MAKKPPGGREMGNQHAIGEWWYPVISSTGRLKDQASAETASELARMSEEELEALSPTPREAEPGLTHPIPFPLGLLSQKAMQLKELERYTGLIEDLFPRAYQLLCNEQKFLRGTEPRELAFIETHGRRWRVGEGIDYSKLPPIAELRFDFAHLEESCKRLRSQFEGILFPAKSGTLGQYVKECHQAVHREQERRKTALRARGVPNAQRVSRQSYRAFVRRGFVFVGTQVLFLKDYIDYRSRGSTAQKAEQLVLAKRRRKLLEKKSLAEERKSST
jgi:hypothetical protein